MKEQIGLNLPLHSELSCGRTPNNYSVGEIRDFETAEIA